MASAKEATPADVEAVVQQSEQPCHKKVSWPCVGIAISLVIVMAFAYSYTSDSIYDDLLVGVALVLTQYLLMSMVFIGVVGWALDRDRWWAGPYCSGFIGFGDGSAAEVAPEKVMVKWGMSTVAKDLYFDSSKWTKARSPRHDPNAPPHPNMRPARLSGAPPMACRHRRRRTLRRVSRGSSC